MTFANIIHTLWVSQSTTTKGLASFPGLPLYPPSLPIIMRRFEIKVKGEEGLVKLITRLTS